MWYLHWIFSEIQGKVVKITWKVSFLKMLSSKDMTLYLMQAVGSEPSTHPDLISSTMLSKGVSFQKPGLEGWAMAPPIKKTRHTTLIDAILTPESWCCLKDGWRDCDSFDKDSMAFIQLFQIQHVLRSSGTDCLGMYSSSPHLRSFVRWRWKCKGKLFDTNPPTGFGSVKAYVTPRLLDMLTF